MKDSLPPTLHGYIGVLDIKPMGHIWAISIFLQSFKESA